MKLLLVFQPLIITKKALATSESALISNVAMKRASPVFAVVGSIAEITITFLAECLLGNLLSLRR